MNVMRTFSLVILSLWNLVVRAIHTFIKNGYFDDIFSGFLKEAWRKFHFNESKELVFLLRFLHEQKQSSGCVL